MSDKFMIENVICKTRDRFELVILAAIRAAQLNRGALPNLTSQELQKEKDVIVALKELAAGVININELRAIAAENNYHNTKNMYRQLPKNSYNSEEEVNDKDLAISTQETNIYSDYKVK